MTQRVELAAVIDRLAIDALITEYAVTVDDGDWDAYQQLFAPGGRADYRSAGGIEGDAAEVAAWLTETMRMFPMRQHLIVNRRLEFGTLDQDIGDSARVRADYVNPMRFAAPPGGTKSSSAPDFVCGGRYAFALLRTHGGWRLREVAVREKWRRVGDQPRATPAKD
ncbi:MULTISPECIES: nuclear transport factor 2 family protein [unclassified Streptomyces]|uniref:nuclear transport factor 2 family protein n=1 Tax=unclassified Streptomyces TaxID=2593676 RepID=UPI001CBC6486|nr:MULTISPECIES: nuclear transport factor 2 family protein [unclassified Streptomyces]WPO75134.1 nuclear transport factor 2 family protein [Streptomyces sp. KN37]